MLRRADWKIATDVAEAVRSSEHSVTFTSRQDETSQNICIFTSVYKYVTSDLK
jgi:hypothetical protein